MDQGDLYRFEIEDRLLDVPVKKHVSVRWEPGSGICRVGVMLHEYTWDRRDEVLTRVLAFEEAHALDGETSLPKDERHPRKHSGPKNAKVGGRGTNQLVRDVYKPAHFAYRSLMEASHRTRYDMKALTSPHKRLLTDHKTVHDRLLTVLAAQGHSLAAFA
jgi:hypothetical protein